MSEAPLEPDLSALEPPPPPPGLRETALSAARLAFVAAPAPDVWTRLLRSPAARLAWAAAVALLAAANVLLPSHSRPPAPTTPATAAAAPDPEMATIARLPRIDDRALPPLPGGPS